MQIDHPILQFKNVSISYTPDVYKRQSQYKTFVEGIDSGAKALFDKDRAAAIEFLTDFSCNTGNHLVDTWRDFYGYLF